jgi:hypothetical protein
VSAFAQARLQVLRQQMRAVPARMPLERRASRVLSVLGPTVIDAAEILRAAQVHGRRHSLFWCPVAVLLCQEAVPDRVQPLGTFVVGVSHVAVRPDGARGAACDIALPGPVADLRALVDGPDGLPGGRYADLVADLVAP